MAKVKIDWRQELERLISNVSDTSFDCGAWDADTPAVKPYQVVLQHSENANDALRQFVYKLMKAPMRVTDTSEEVGK